MDRMLLVLQPDPAQERALEALLAAQQDPQSPQFHQWLTPERFGKLFGVSDHDLAQVVEWLERQGFQVESPSSGRRVLLFSGTAGQVETAFHTSIHTYKVNGVTHHANSSDPRIPMALASVVEGVASLHDFRSQPLHQGLKALAASDPQYTSGATHYLTPADFATIYDVAALYSSSIDGTGQSIAIVGRTNFAPGDITNFRSTFGLPANAPTVVLNGSNPGIVSSDEQTEAELDVEWSGAVAKNASIKFVLSASTNSTDGALLSSEYIVNHNVAPVMSSSFGLCEAAIGTSGNQFFNSLWQQAAAEGISVLIASGDSGAAGCDSPSVNHAVNGTGVNGICSTPYSTCVGGTQFNDTATPALFWATTNSNNYASALSYIPELVWNGSAGTSGGSGLWASGGGASGIYSKPVWQAGPGVPADGKRDVPDVSLNAAIHDAYLFFLNGQLYLVGGTSAAAPTMAGILAMTVEHGGAPLGNANPILYGLATNQGNGGAAVFHDVTAGNNSVPGASGFNAGPGYDLATGLGSVDAFQLVNHWSDATSSPAPGFQWTASAPSVTLAPGSSAGLQVNVAVTNGFNSAVSFSTDTLPPGVTAQFSPASLAAPGSGSSNLTLAATVNAPSGAYTVYLTASGGAVSKTVPLAINIQSSCSYSINPTSAAPTATGGNFSATITTSSGCSWNASSTVNWITLLNGASGNGSGNLMYSVQPNSSANSRTGSLSIAGSSLTVTQSGTAPAVPPLSPASASYPSSGGHGSVTVTLPSNGTWTASSNSSWITITSAGNKTVNYSVASNTGAARSGNLTIAGLAFPVTQSGATCTYSVTLGNMLATSGGFAGSAKVSTGAACSWNASSNVNWITVTSGSSVTGPGTANFFVANNPKSTVRTGNLIVAGYTIQITEGTKGSVKLGKPVH